MNIDNFKDKIKTKYTGNTPLEKLEILLDMMDECYYMGVEDGNQDGYKICLEDNHLHTREEEIEQTWEDGYSQGREEAYGDGRSDGYDEGFSEGETNGYDQGYEEGQKDAERNA